jgi:hypothetical protein
MAKQPTTEQTHTFRIGLRHHVKDFITGATGIVVTQLQYITGCDRYEVAPAEVKDGAPVSTFFIDEARIIDSVNVKKNENTDVDFVFELGEHVEDIVTGRSGYIVCRYGCLAGFSRYATVEKLKDAEDKKESNWSYFDEHQLKATKRKAVELAPTKKPGGPGTNAPKSFG